MKIEIYDDTVRIGPKTLTKIQAKGLYEHSKTTEGLAVLCKFKPKIKPISMDSAIKMESIRKRLTDAGSSLLPEAIKKCLIIPMFNSADQVMGFRAHLVMEVGSEEMEYRAKYLLAEHPSLDLEGCRKLCDAFLTEKIKLV